MHITVKNVYHLTPFFLAAILLTLTLLVFYALLMSAKERDIVSAIIYGLFLMTCSAMWPMMISPLAVAWAGLGLSL